MVIVTDIDRLGRDVIFIVTNVRQIMRQGAGALLGDPGPARLDAAQVKRDVGVGAGRADRPGRATGARGRLRSCLALP
ncbi:MULTISPECIES: hypothetical protein [Sorangium]|uniref:hypothetical protein n=1 Tax=Sorangium TaxID=39643 RepID=UPI003D9C5CA0